MALTVGSAEFPNLTGQPFGYDEKDVRRGITARKWSVSGLLTPTEWLALLDEYDAWRDIRITEQDPAKSFDQGTTVLLAGTGPGEVSWSVECWFSSAPKGEQSGAYVSATVELVDAAQALETLNKDVEDADEPPVDLGTVSVGSGANIATLTLLRPMESYGEGPTLELTATGKYYTTGPLTVRKIRDIEGTTSSGDWDKIRDWYEEVIQERPVVGTWFPISVPSATAKNKLVEGTKQVEYTVTIQLAYVI